MYEPRKVFFLYCLPLPPFPRGTGSGGGHRRPVSQLAGCQQPGAVLLGVPGVCSSGAVLYCGCYGFRAGLEQEELVVQRAGLWPGTALPGDTHTLPGDTHTLPEPCSQTSQVPRECPEDRESQTGLLSLLLPVGAPSNTPLWLPLWLSPYWRCPSPPVPVGTVSWSDVPAACPLQRSPPAAFWPGV